MDELPCDFDLLARYVAGDRGALAVLVERYLDLVYSAARRQLGGDPHRAQDVAQQVFVLLMRKAAALRGQPVLASWLLKVTRYECGNVRKVEARRQRRERKVAQMTPEAPDAGGRPGGDNEELRWDEVGPHVDAAMGTLSATDRDAVVLRYFQNVSYAQAAAALGGTEASVRQRVHRALQRLRSALAARGLIVSEVALGTALAAHAVEAAPVALKGLTLGMLAQQTAGAITAKGVFSAMATTQSKAIAAAVLLALLAVGGVLTVILTNPGGQPPGASQANSAGPPSAATTGPGPAVSSSSSIDVVNPPPARPVVAKPAPPRKLFDVIPALTYDDARGTRRGYDHIAYINAGDWVRYDSVDFGPPDAPGSLTFCAALMCSREYAGRIITVRLDSPTDDGPMIAALRVRATTEEKFVVQTAPVEGVNGGVHDVFLTFDGGGFNLKNIKFVRDSRPAMAAIKAGSYVEAVGTQYREQEKVLGDSTDGGWARYEVDFGGADAAGIEALGISYAVSAANAGGTIRFRLDRQDGPVVAEVPLESTGGFRSFGTRWVKLLQPVTGRHDVFLVFAGANGRQKGIADVDWFRFGKAPPPPPRVLPPTTASTRATVAPSSGPVAPLTESPPR
jgi:RNA polymerase sigma factor (sigma-70 family)